MMNAVRMSFTFKMTVSQFCAGHPLAQSLCWNTLPQGFQGSSELQEIMRRRQEEVDAFAYDWALSLSLGLALCSPSALATTLQQPPASPSKSPCTVYYFSHYVSTSILYIIMICFIYGHILSSLLLLAVVIYSSSRNNNSSSISRSSILQLLLLLLLLL